MTEVNVTKTIQAPANKIWETISSFRGIEKFSPIAKSVTEGEGAGAKRTCYMPDGAEIHEVLTEVDQDVMQLQYIITEGPFPVQGYLSTVKVTEVDQNSCTVSWGSQYEVSDEAAPDMKELFEGFYNVIIDSLETLSKGSN
ncbi:MAG: SRPBCC family protein [Roseivirga sp.]|nr:SRPBCC family protein [Roseivirga sp.]